MQTTANRSTDTGLGTFRDLSDTKQAQVLLEETLAKSPFSNVQRGQIALAVCEAVYIFTGGRDGTSRSIMSVVLNDVRLQVDLVDPGDDAPCAERADRSLEPLSEERDGIFLMRRVMDEVHYRYRRGFQNHLRLVKFTPA
jgi:anti-sigma regulatory factor (Ser/Thr protein kinase)